VATPHPPNDLGAHDRLLLRATDEEWRPARELAQRAGFPRTLAPAALRRLLDTGAIEATPGDGPRRRLVYRRASLSGR
jgi:hypothetical protein